MPRVTLRGQGAIAVADPDQLVGLTDLEIGNENGAPVLYATARGGGVLSRISLGNGDAPAILQGYWTIPTRYLQLESTDLALVEGAGGAKSVMLAGLADNDLRGRVETGSGLGGAVSFDAGNFDLGQISAIAMAPDGVRAIAALRGGGLAQLTFTSNGQVSVSMPGGMGALGGQSASAVSWVDSGGSAYGVASFAGSDQIALLRAGVSGQMSLVDVVGSANGAWIDSPGAVLTVTESDGVPYAVVAASGSSSLTVLRIEGNTMRPVDHVIDSLETRFDSADHLAVVDIGGQPFVVAAGSDEGLTVLSLLPGGQLLEVASLPASPGTPLNGISVLDAVVIGDTARIFVATQGAPYLVEFSFTLDNPGVTRTGDTGPNALTGTGADDMIVGAAGNDTLVGGAGSDLLADGEGTDVMTGGAGADTFLLTADGAIDRITDFQRGSDRIEIRAPQPGLGADDIVVISRSWGAEVHIGDEILRVHSADGDPLSWADFDNDVLGLTASISTNLSAYPDHRPDYGPETGSTLDPTLRYQRPSFDFPVLAQPVITVNPVNAQIGGFGDDVLQGPQSGSRIDGQGGNDRIDGSNTVDVLVGAAGFDTIFGLGGNDSISGGDHADLLEGGAGHDAITGGSGFDVIRGGSGNDRMWGGSSPDRIWGGDGNDWIDAGINYGYSVDGVWGEGGNDTIYGSAGFDFLSGGAGDDSIDGGHQADNIFGEDGDDMLYGGQGLDRLFGGTGNDTLFGGEGPDGHFGDDGNDRMWGGAGNDRFFGGFGNDYIEGGEGNDTLIGNAGFDTLIGGAGDDFLYGRFNADRFVFEDGHGHDQIFDFDALNVLEVLDFGDLNAFNTTSDVMAQAQRVGSDVLITTGTDSSILLVDVSLGDLDGRDFLF